MYCYIIHTSHRSSLLLFYPSEPIFDSWHKPLAIALRTVHSLKVKWSLRSIGFMDLPINCISEIGIRSIHLSTAGETQHRLITFDKFSSEKGGRSDYLDFEFSADKC